jgi:hypothetical protein
MSPSLSPIISTFLRQVANNYSESEHSSDRIEPLLPEATKAWIPTYVEIHELNELKD